MEQVLFNQKYFTYRKIALVIILLSILVYSFTGEKLPYNNGLGWDGLDYYSILQNFRDSYINHEINAYHIQRILPFAIIHYTYLLFGIEVTPQSAVMGCSVLNFICILLTVLYFFKISKKCKWNPTTETIAFAICFFNVPILKFFGYYTMLADCPAYLLSYMAIYYFITDNKIMEVVVGIMAMVTWPILALVIWVLTFFPRNQVKELNEDDKTSKVISVLVRTIYTLWLPLLFITTYVVFFTYLHPEFTFMRRYIHRPPINYVHAFVSLLATACLFYQASNVFRLCWKSVITIILQKRNLCIILVSFIGFVCLYMASKYYGGKSSFSPLKEALLLQELPVSDILIVIESHFLYLGLFFLMIILLWKDVAKEVCGKMGIGCLLVFMLGLFFVADIETRKLVSFYPVYLIPLMGVINKRLFKEWVPIAFVIYALVMSFFWWKINVPGIEESFIARIDNYRAFPAQRYFMFMGPWQSRGVYIITLTAEVIIGAVIIYLHKKQLLYKTQE